LVLSRNDRIRLQHMRDAARKAVRVAARGSRQDLENEDDPLVDALIRLIAVIGDAAKSVSDETRTQLAAIRWSEIKGMRDRVVHAYFDVNLDILWATVRDDLPPLIQALEDGLEAGKRS
jgi:uncharacterized protein with HEPN domain